MKSSALRYKLLFLMSFLVVSAYIYACGTGGSPNEGTCSGTLLNSGSLTPSSGTQGTPSVASGTVNVYDQGSGTYCINIAGISYTGPCTGAMVVQAQVGGAYDSAGSITIFSGSQNFYFNAGSAPSWVYFHCLTDLPAPNGMYAKAQLL
jgi:hypothetical protein